MTARRRNRLRLLLRDLAALAAFASMAISGVLPLWAIAGYGVCSVLALLDLRILSRRGAVTAVLLAAIALALYGLVAAGTLDLVLAACTFAGFISAQRQLSAKAPELDAQIHLTSLLMVAGGAALSGDLLFAVAVAFFVVLGMLSLGLAVIERALPEGADFDLRPVMWRLGGAALLALIGSVIFFVAFPRLSWNLAGRKIAPGLGGTPISGISDRVRLSGDGTIKRNPRIVLRARLSPDPKVDQLQGYWQGRTYATFDGHEWVGDGEVRPASSQVRLGDPREGRIHQQIELLPGYGSQTTVALETPVVIANATAHTPQGSQRVMLRRIAGEEVRFETSALSYTYHAYSSPDSRAGRGVPDSELLRYLLTPEGLDPRIEALAREIVGAEEDPLAAARKLEAHLTTQYRYTLELSTDPDPLTAFLFERKEGHCEHFATALAILLRTLGHPSRVAAGFYGGERIDDHFVVRAGDAHAWTQVLVPGRGWVTVDATPAQHRVGQTDTAWAWLIARYEWLEERWRDSVLDYAFIDQLRFVRELARPPRDAPAARKNEEGAERPWLAAGLAAVLAYAAWRLPWRRRAARPRREEATRLLDDVEALLARVALRPAPGEGLEELSAGLAERRHPLADPVGRVTRRYLEARFGDRPLQEGERRRWVRTLEHAIEARRARAGGSPP